jgi:hypothetical protein
MTIIPQIGEEMAHTPPTHKKIPTTRDHPPFILPIPKPLIDLYQLGDATTRPALEEAKRLSSDLNVSHETTTKDIDKAAKLVIIAIQNYHKLVHTAYQLANRTTPRTHPSSQSPHVNQ